MLRASLLRRFRIPLQYHLVALVVIALVPALIGAGVLVWTLGNQRRAVEARLQAAAGALAVAVEREVAASVTTLEVLATSTALDRGDLDAFSREAMRVIRVARLSDMAVTDARGQILMSRVSPSGMPVRSIADGGDVSEVIRSGRSVVSDLITGQVTIAVPVHREGALRFVLVAAMRAESLGAVLAAPHLPAGWTAGIAGRHGRIAQNDSGIVPPEVARDLDQTVSAAPAGTTRVSLAGGPDIYAGWQRTTSLGWTVAVGAPESALDVSRRRLLWNLALSGLLVVFAAAVLAMALWWRISGAAGRFLSGAVGLGRVGFALERAGETIAERTAELQRSRAKLKRVVESSLIGILVREGDRITEANDAFLDMVGYSREDLRQGTLLWRTLTPPEYEAADATARAAARQTGACPPDEKEYVRRDGTRVSVLVGRVLLDEARDEWVAFALDLTERKRLEAERGLRIQAQTADHAKDEFLAIVSHELRTPLGVTLTSVHALRRAGLGAPQAAGILDRIERSTRLQARLINDLLNVSRIIAGKLPVDKKPVPMLPIVSDAVTALLVEASDKGVGIRTALDAPPAPVLADPERLQEIVLNLVVNAIKFTPAGGHIEVSLASRAGRVVLTVRDTGRGIAPELLPHIFDRFRQGEGAARQGGLGLGLAIVWHLVQAHDGTVGAESPGLGGGAVFTVELPLHDAGDEAAAGGVANGAPPEPAAA